MSHRARLLGHDITRLLGMRHASRPIARAAAAAPVAPRRCVLASGTAPISEEDTARMDAARSGSRSRPRRAGRARARRRPRTRDAPSGVPHLRADRGPAGPAHPRIGHRLQRVAHVPCYSNLVYFNPAKALETADTVIPELAEKWSWQDLPETSSSSARTRQVARREALHVPGRQVHVRRVVREAPEAPAKLRLSARKDWYANVEAIEAADPYRGVPAQAAAALAAADAGLGLLAGVPAHVPLRASCGRSASALRAVQAEGVRARRSSISSATGLSRAGRTSTASAT
jgi:hypothetical protein